MAINVAKEVATARSVPRSVRRGHQRSQQTVAHQTDRLEITSQRRRRHLRTRSAIGAPDRD